MTRIFKFLILFLLCANLGLAFVLFAPSGTDAEIRAMRGASRDEKVALYRALIERVGVIEAQERLYRSGLPFTGETHLVNHLSGDYLYKQEGIGGIVHCKDYFLSSCHHGLLLHAIAEKGVESLSEAMEVCYKEGSAVATQCAHGIGHGLLAWLGYKELPEALQRCKALRAKDSRFPLFNCQDGVFMENLWAVHEDGTPSPDRWIRENDPFYPCSDPRITPEWQGACWSNQPSVLYQAFGGDIRKTGEWCAKAPEEHRAMCFNGLARQIHPLTRGSAEETFALCGLLPEAERNTCAITIAASDYAVGGREAPFAICADIVSEARSECYRNLYAMMETYRQNEPAETLCAPTRKGGAEEECRAALERPSTSSD